MTTKPAVPTELRRPLFNDPEFPYWTKNPEPGMVCLLPTSQSRSKMVACVILYVYRRSDSHQVEIEARPLTPRGDDLAYVQCTQKYYMDLNDPEDEIKIIDRMYRHGCDGGFFETLYHVDPIDYTPLMAKTRDNTPTHDQNLSETNPLRFMPFWGGTKNLTILDCLEWAQTHLKFENRRLPCIENDQALEAIATAISAQERRKIIRKHQGVLGTNNPHNSELTP